MIRAEALAAWLADYFVLATILLAAAIVAQRFVRQPKRRLAIVWVVLGELIVLAGICALPAWPRISVLPASSSAQAVSVAPVAAAGEIAKVSQSTSIKNGTAVVSSASPVVAGPSSKFKFPSLSAAIGMAYMTGMAITGLWLLWGAIGTARLCRDATQAPPSLYRELQQLVGGERLPRLLLSHKIGNAAAVGILRPTILLQTEFAQQESSHARRAILAHEWAHLCNRDLWLLALERVLRLLLFAHPLYWLLRGHIRADQEVLADAKAASENRHDYAQDLLTFARLSADCRPMHAIGAVGILENPNQLSRRIAMLLDESFRVQASVSRWWQWRAILVFVMLGTLFSLMTLQPGCATKSTAEVITTQPRNVVTRTLKMRIVDAEGRPLEGVNVYANISSKEPSGNRDYTIVNRNYTSDASGMAVVELFKEMDLIRIWTDKSGYVPMFTHWEEKWFAAGNSVPEEVTVTLPKGTVIGGFVKNEQGQPIVGAKVAVITGGGDQQQLTSISEWLAEGEDARVTDANGRWTLDNVPEGDGWLMLSVTHPEYVSDLTWGGLQHKQGVTTVQLREQKATIVMQRGASLTGAVRDQQGKGVAGAVVGWGDDPYGDTGMHQEHRQQVLTDANGVYRFQPMSSMPLTVTVVAKGWMPELKKTTVSPEHATLDFQLKKGKSLRLRFVDSEGKAIPEVWVGINGWRGCKSLYNTIHPIVLETAIPEQANKDGIFEWSWAPDDTVDYQFAKKGYKWVKSKSIVAGEGGTAEQTIQLERE
ncbi:MAG: M56 family metallopeptidase [Phycisphaerales bacterium]|nr:M56 family metallopeptidase [Phycisphaerales bacterium]